MAEYLNTWDDGQKKWIKKQTTPNPLKGLIPIDQLLPISLIGCDIKSDVINVSFVIIHDGVVYAHYELSAVKDWVLNENVITINTNDAMFKKYIFISVEQAQKADNRLLLIMNGNSIINCDDDSPMECGDIRNLRLS